MGSSRWLWGQRNSASLVPKQVKFTEKTAWCCAGRPGLPGGHGVRGQLRVGQPRVHDVPVPPGIRQDLWPLARRAGHAPRVRRVAQHRQGAPEVLTQQVGLQEPAWPPGMCTHGPLMPLVGIKLSGQVRRQLCGGQVSCSIYLLLSACIGRN